MKTTKTMTANPPPRSEPRGGNTTGNHPPLPQSHTVLRRFPRPAAVLALALATGLWALLHPLTALAAAPVSLTLKGQWPGYARGPALDVAVQGQYAYVATSEGGLVILDVTDPANPVRVGGVDTSGDARGVAVAGSYAYVADGEAGLHVIDVSDPANPVRVGGVDTSGYALGVAVVGNHAYVADGHAGLQVIDVSDPANPVRVGGYNTSARGVAVAGDYSYVADWDAGLHVIDVSDPRNPVRVGGYDTSGGASAVAVVGDLIYVADGEWGLLILEQFTLPPPPTQWVRIPTDPASTPAGREFAAMVYDEQREVIVMHGGWNRQGRFNETWEWDGKSWTLVSTEGPAVSFPAMAYDANRGVTVLYGGRNDNVGIQNLNETWEWDGETWTRMEAGSEDAKLVLMTFVYDQERTKVIRHGGVISGDYVNPDPATYEWDGTNWTAFSAGSHVRGAAVAVYESNQSRTIAFGGGSTTNVYQPPITENETWAFDGAEWHLVASGEGPAGRVFHAMVYDTYRGVGVLFGGSTLPSGVEFSDTWEWNGLQWSESNVQGSPGPRFGHAMAYDPKRRRVVLFGGGGDAQDEGTRFRNDLWELGLMPLRVTVTSGSGDGMLKIHWSGEAPPYQFQSRASLNAGDWQNEGAPTEALSTTVQTDGAAKFFRVLSLFGSAQ